MSSKCNLELLDQTKQSAIVAFRTASKRAIQKTAEATGDLIGTNLYNTPHKPTKFRTKNLVEINDDARGTFNTNSQTKCKTAMLKSSLCDYSDVNILVERTITVARVLAPLIPDNGGNEMVFNKWSSIYWLLKWNTHYVNSNDKNIDVVMPV